MFSVSAPTTKSNAGIKSMMIAQEDSNGGMALAVYDTVLYDLLEGQPHKQHALWLTHVQQHKEALMAMYSSL